MKKELESMRSTRIWALPSYYANPLGQTYRIVSTRVFMLGGDNSLNF